MSECKCKPEISLRDYFAGQALAGILASLDCDSTASVDGLAVEAYLYADAMIVLSERAKDA